MHSSSRLYSSYDQKREAKLGTVILQVSASQKLVHFNISVGFVNGILCISFQECTQVFHLSFSRFSLSLSNQGLQGAISIIIPESYIALKC